MLYLVMLKLILITLVILNVVIVVHNSAAHGNKKLTIGVVILLALFTMILATLLAVIDQFLLEMIIHTLMPSGSGGPRFIHV